MDEIYKQDYSYKRERYQVSHWDRKIVQDFYDGPLFNVKP